MDHDCDLWSKTDSDDDEMTLAIIPPLEKACVDSDRDSDASDDLCNISITYAHKLHSDVTLLARFICMFVLLIIVNTACFQVRRVLENIIVNTACFQVRRVLENITWCQKLFELSKYESV